MAGNFVSVSGLIVHKIKVDEALGRVDEPNRKIYKDKEKYDGHLWLYLYP